MGILNEKYLFISNNVVYFHANFRDQENKNFDLQNVIRNVFIDLPPGNDTKYNFYKHPPKTTGQIGVPLIIDSLLGNAMIIFPTK